MSRPGEGALLLSFSVDAVVVAVRGHAKHVLQDVLITVNVLGGRRGGGVAAAGSFWRRVNIFATVLR